MSQNNDFLKESAAQTSFDLIIAFPSHCLLESW